MLPLGPLQRGVDSLALLVGLDVLPAAKFIGLLHRLTRSVLCLFQDRERLSADSPNRIQLLGPLSRSLLGELSYLVDLRESRFRTLQSLGHLAHRPIHRSDALLKGLLMLNQLCPRNGVGRRRSRLGGRAGNSERLSGISPLWDLRGIRRAFDNQLLDDLLNERFADFACGLCVRREHRVVADLINQSGHALRVPVHRVDGPAGEHLPLLIQTGNAKPVVDIARGDFPTHGGEVKAAEHALLELLHRGSAKGLLQLRLSEDQHLKELCVIGFEIAQQPKFLKRFKRQILSLVENDDGQTIARVLLQQKVLQRPGDVSDRRIR